MSICYKHQRIVKALALSNTYLLYLPRNFLEIRVGFFFAELALAKVHLHASFIRRFFKLAKKSPDGVWKRGRVHFKG